MTRKNSKTNRKTTRTTIWNLGIDWTDGSFTTLAKYDVVSNTFVCPECGSKMAWVGGRFAPKNLSHTMEAIECSNCRHTVDPRLIMKAATQLYREEQTRIARIAYQVKVEDARREYQRQMDIAEYERKANSLKGQLKLAMGMTL